MARSTYFDLGRSAGACPGSESGYAQRFQCGNIVKRRIWTRMLSNRLIPVILVAQNPKGGEHEHAAQVSIRKSDEEETNSDGRCLAVSLLRNYSRGAAAPEVKDHRWLSVAVSLVPNAGANGSQWVLRSR